MTVTTLLSCSRHRRWLERRGWRTTLEYRENHVRDADGVLVEVVALWVAEAERHDRRERTTFVTARADTADRAWRHLRHDAAAARSVAVDASAGAASAGAPVRPGRTAGLVATVGG